MNSATSRLAREARRPRTGRPSAPERVPVAATARETADRCDLCSAQMTRNHRHVIDIEERSLLCVCRACCILFDRREAGGGRYRLVPRRVLRLDGFVMREARWSAFQVPVGLAFFFRNSRDGRVTAFSPAPRGPTESVVSLDSWRQLEADNPVLRDMESDIEALLVNRANGANEYWIVPVDTCYRLVGLIRRLWKGLAGGRQVWAAIEGFFTHLSKGAVDMQPPRRVT